MRISAVWYITIFLALCQFEFVGSISALYGALLITAISRQLKARDLLSFEYQLYGAIGVFLSIYHTFTTNILMQQLQTFGWWVVLGLLLARGVCRDSLESPRSLAKAIVSIALSFLNNLTLIKRHKGLIPTLPRGKSLQASQISSICIAFSLLVVFHFLFASINQNYEAWSASIVDALLFIVKMVNITLICQSLLCAYLINSILLICEQDLIIPNQPLNKSSLHLTIILSPLIILFLLFSIFQGQYLFTNIGQMAFKTLSLYVQKGFWELLGVALIGYGIWLFSDLTNRKENENYRMVFNLQFFFTVELLIVCIFTLHKLFSLQLYFGFKDQRILATAATLLILGTFILCFLKCKDKISATKILRTQVFGLLSIILILSILNVDLFISKYNSVSYYNSTGKSKDISYLLTNSFDNYDAWPNIIAYAKLRGIDEPKDYYWGDYSPICTKRLNYYGSGHTTLFDDHIVKLRNTTYGIRNVLKLNMRRYLVSLHFINNQANITQLASDLRAICQKNDKEIPSS